MSIEVKVGQVWKDKDKRRNTVIEIIEVTTGYDEPLTVQGLVVGTEKVNTYAVDRLTKSWELVTEKEPERRAAVKELVQLDKTPAEHQTREDYLELAVQAIIKDIFEPAKVEVPPVRVSVGWPGGRGPKKNVIGQCFDKRTSKDGVAQIFVTPAIDDAYVTIETLTHELIHAIVEGHEDENGEVKHHGHRGEFVRIARAIGFMKPWKETPASEELREQLQAIADRLGEYPHAAITMEDRPAVQKTYYLLLESVSCDECPDGYKLRMTEKWIEEVGAPLCPHGIEMEEPQK